MAYTQSITTEAQRHRENENNQEPEGENLIQGQLSF
jgi:hypothetical protein